MFLPFCFRTLSKIVLNFSVLFKFLWNRPCICSYCFCAGLSASAVQPPTVKVVCQIWCTCICPVLPKVINAMQNEGYLLHPKRNHCSQMWKKEWVCACCSPLEKTILTVFGSGYMKPFHHYCYQIFKYWKIMVQTCALFFKLFMKLFLPPPD